MTGIVAALGQAPLDLWPLTVIAMAVLVWRLSILPIGATRIAFWRLLAAGTGYFAIGMLWIVDPFYVEPDLYAWMAPFALILTALGGGLFWAIPGWIGWRIAAPTRTNRAVAVGAALVLSDWLRGWIFTGLPWALLGHVWIPTPAGQIAAWGGSILLSALTMAAAVVPTVEWRGTARSALRGVILSILLIAAAWFAGLARLAQPEPPATGITLRLVQPDAKQALKWDPDWVWVFYERLLDLSHAPPKGPAPDAVIWPETSVPFLLDQAADALPQIAASANGSPVLMGIQRSENGVYFNSLIEVDRDGRVGLTYDKFHLVPFGEYVPWGDYLSRWNIGAFAAQQGFGYAKGTGPRMLSVPGLPDFQPLICYEAVFSRHLRATGQRPAWILQITNDAWFGNWSGPYQHLAQVRLRAIESGLPLMRSANTGVTAAIDARGRVLGSLPLNTQGALDAALPGALPPTLWWRFGDWPAVMLSALALVATVRRRRKT
ncbi:MAG: apolipoprotein N-acyltransferase [Paracoccus denitrificans]|nr:MAG: apolipoprotein N-acyltransferase [Paracoccus denitrificans]PZO83436.1 MAG: apolipoprotein N-acyltransferase [Paracoccus denitrificans]